MGNIGEMEEEIPEHAEFERETKGRREQKKER